MNLTDKGISGLEKIQKIHQPNTTRDSLWMLIEIKSTVKGTISEVRKSQYLSGKGKEDQKGKVILGYIEKSRPVWAI